jgi:hypothetical protein
MFDFLDGFFQNPTPLGTAVAVITVLSAIAAWFTTQWNKERTKRIEIERQIKKEEGEKFYNTLEKSVVSLQQSVQSLNQDLVSEKKANDENRNIINRIKVKHANLLIKAKSLQQSIEGLITMATDRGYEEDIQTIILVYKKTKKEIEQIEQIEEENVQY